MVNRALRSCDRPLQRIAGLFGRNGEAILDPRLNFCAFFVVVPRDQLQGRQLLSRVVETIDFRKCLQPRLSALLSHDAAESPTCQRVVKSLVGGADCLFVREGNPRVVEPLEITHPIIRRGGHHPGVAAIAQHVGESAVVLKKKNRWGRHRGLRCVPIHGVMQVNIEICNHRTALQSQICLRRKVGLFDVLQIADECLLR